MLVCTFPCKLTRSHDTFSSDLFNKKLPYVHKRDKTRSCMFCWSLGDFLSSASVKRALNYKHSLVGFTAWPSSGQYFRPTCLHAFNESYKVIKSCLSTRITILRFEFFESPFFSHGLDLSNEVNGQGLGGDPQRNEHSALVCFELFVSTYRPSVYCHNIDIPFFSSFLFFLLAKTVLWQKILVPQGG